ncbi:MAG: glutathione S-transferase N-terminal domain-containing protein [Polyangiaceae bacterium]|nr:glutathione S-transferase N-terminal domain-containing protein [Polyangiaceae bacterium]
MWRPVDVGTSLLASGLRLGAGLRVGRLGPRPRETLELYDEEGCPYCRKVREALSELDLEARIWPCPAGGERYRAEAERRGGKRQFPLLVDASLPAPLYESDAIVRHLHERYGAGRPPLWARPGQLLDALSVAATGTRGTRGLRARPGRRAPERALELWSFEASPYCRIVRELLTELELPYLLHNVAKRSPSRPAFVARSGRMMVPYLVDPNTSRELFESADIARYLTETYG